MPDALLAPTFLFRFAAPCRHTPRLWSNDGPQLSAKHRLPCLAELEGRRPFAEVRVGWNAQGLAASVEVSGKTKSLWCRQSRLEDSDGVRLWINTRDTHNIHRASRFCHQFIFLPEGGGKSAQQPLFAAAPIHRAKEHPKPIPQSSVQIASSRLSGGYCLSACIDAETLTGFDPQEHPRLGFFYAVVDRELGWQTLSVGAEFPFQEDPSVWGTLELMR